MSLLILLPLDILLVVVALLAYLSRPRIGGQLARGLRWLLLGVLLLGAAHAVEIPLLMVFDLHMVVGEIVHRLLVVCAYCLIILGFVMMRRAFDG